MLGIDRDEKKRRHFTLVHENIEFRYHHENQGKIYWACKVSGCPGMVEEDHYKMKLIRSHEHPTTVKTDRTKRWQSNPWYHNDTTDKYKYDPTEAYNINNSIKPTRPSKPVPIPPSWHSKGDNRAPRFYYFDMPPSNTQTKSVPASVVRGHPPVGPKRSYHDSDPNMSDGTESLRSMMECDTHRQQRFWIVMGILGLVALIIVAIALSFYFIDKSRFNNQMAKGQNSKVLHQITSDEPVTSTTDSTTQTTSQQQDTTLREAADRSTVTTQQTSTQTKATETTTEATSTSSVTSQPTQTTPPPSSSLSTAPVVFSGSFVLNKSWTPALNDSASPEYQVFSKAIVYEIDTAFLTSPMKHLFNNSKVTGYSPGSVKVFFKITFYTVVREDGQVDTMSVNVTDVQQTIEREATRQQTTRTNGLLGAVMAESITIKLLNAPVVFTGDLSLNEAWTDALNDPTSTVFKNLTSRLKKELLSSLMNSIENEFLDVQIVGLRKGSINVIFKIIMTINTTKETPFVDVSSVIQAIQSEANRQLQEAVTGLLQKLISLSVENQTLANTTTSAQSTTTLETTTTQPATTKLITQPITQPETTTTQPATTKLTTQPITQPETTTTQPATTKLTTQPITQPETTTTQPATTKLTTQPITQPETTTTQPTTTKLTTQPITQPETTTTQPTTTTLTTQPITQPETTTTQRTTEPEITTTQPETTTDIQQTTDTTQTIMATQPPTTTNQTTLTIHQITSTTQPPSISQPTTTTTQPTTTKLTTQPITQPETTTTQQMTTTLTTQPTTKPETTTTQRTTEPKITTSQPETTTDIQQTTDTTQTIMATQPPTTTKQTTSITQQISSTTQPTTTIPQPTTTTTQQTTKTTRLKSISSQPTTKITQPTTTTTQPLMTTIPSITTTSLPTTTTIQPTTTTIQQTTTSQSTATVIQTTLKTTYPTTTTLKQTTTTTQPRTTTTQPITTTLQPATMTTQPTTKINQPITTTTQPTTTTIHPLTSTTQPTQTTTQPTTATIQSSTTTIQPTKTTQPTTTTTQPSTTKIQSKLTTTQQTMTSTQPTIQPTTTTLLTTTTTTKTDQPTTTTTQQTTTTIHPLTTTTQMTTTQPSTQQTTTTLITTTTQPRPTTTRLTTHPTTSMLLTTTTKATTTQPPVMTKQPPMTTILSTTTTTQPTTTTTQPMMTTTLPTKQIHTITTSTFETITPVAQPLVCQERKPIATKGWFCALPYYNNLTTKISSDEFCRIMRDIFTCIVDNVEKDSNVTCLPGTLETVAAIYGPTLESTLETAHSIKLCDFRPIVETTAPSTLSSTSEFTKMTYPAFQTSLQTQTPTTISKKITSGTTPMTTTSGTTPMTTSPAPSQCSDSNIIITKGWNCVVPQVMNITAAADFDKFCSIVLDVFDCILDGIGKQFNVSCDQSDRDTAIRLFSPMFKNAFNLQQNPTECYIVSSTVTSTPQITSSQPSSSSSLSTSSETVTTITTSLTPNPLLVKCKDDGVVLDKSLQCVLPHFEQISSTKDNKIFCRLVDQIFQCIIDKIESEFEVTCSDRDKELAIMSYGPTLQSSLGLSFAPTKCELETTTITTPYTSSSAVPESKTTTLFTPTTRTTDRTTTTVPPSSPMTVPITTSVSSTTTSLSPLQLRCQNEAEIMARGWQCALPLYSNLTTSSDLPDFCRAVRGVIVCILDDIGSKNGVNCSRSDQQNALSFYGSTLHSSLPLKFNPANCSWSSDEMSVDPLTIVPETISRVTSLPVTISSPVIPSTDSLSLSVCRDSRIILAKGWVCALPKYMDISTTNDLTVFCSAADSVFTCILDSISSEYGLTCTTNYKDIVIGTYSPNLRDISITSLDPRQCYITTVTPTTTTESPLLAKCQDSATITSAAYFCFLPLYINMTTASDKSEFCSVIGMAFSCIVKKIETDYSIRCREGDKEMMIYNYGSDLTTSLQLRFDPINDCYNMSSEKHKRIARSARLAQYSPCQDSVELFAKGIYCFYSLYDNILHLFMENSSFEDFCSGVANFSSCVMTEMGKGFKVPCDETEQEIFISNHSDSLQETFGLAFSPVHCLMTTTTVETTTLPNLCLDSELIYLKLMVCGGLVFSSLKSEKDFKSFCGLSITIFQCIITKIETSEKTTCSKSDAASIAKLHGQEIYQRLALPFNPSDCYPSASTSTEPIPPTSTSITEPITTTSSPATEAITQTLTDSSYGIPTESTTNPTTIEPSPCRDLNKVNMYILPCIGPVFSYISSTKNSTSFCGLMMRVFDCIMNKTESDGNVTCSSDDKMDLMEGIGLQMNKTLQLPFSPDLCTFLLEKFLIESTRAFVTSTAMSLESSSPLMSTISTTPATTEPSPCQDVNRMNVFILPCIGPLFSSISSAKNNTAFCGYIMEVFDCIINKTEIETNRTCSQEDARNLVQTIGIQMNQTLPLHINPILCSERYSNVETTTITSEFTTISVKECKSKSEIFSQGIHCIGPYYKFVTAATEYAVVCSLIQYTFECMLERIERQYNITCTTLDRNEAKTLYAVDVYKGIPLKFQPDSCPENISCFIEVGKPEYRECFETLFIFDKYNGTLYNLKLSETELCSAYWGTLLCLQNRQISCSIEDTHKIFSHYLPNFNFSIIIPGSCSKNTTLPRSVCEDGDFPLLMIQAKCGFYPILLPFDCDRHGWEYIECAAGSIDPLKCSVDSVYSAVTVLMQANLSFFDRINPGRGEEVYSCINKTTFDWISTYKPKEEDDDGPPRPLAEVIRMALSITISDAVWTADLLDPSSEQYRRVAGYVMNNLTIAFGSEPRILQIEVISFRNTILENATTVDLEVTYNTTSLSSLDVDLQPENDTDPELFYNLKVVSVSEFSTNTRNSSCPAVTSESLSCNDMCKDDFYCQSFQKCCSTGCGRACQNSTDFRANFTEYLTYPISQILPKKAEQLLFSVTLPDFNWTNSLLDPQSSYYNKVHAAVVRNFIQQMQSSPEFLDFDVLSLREGGFVIADIILTYDRYLISSSSVVNNLYMLHRHGFIQNLKIQGDVSYDKLVKPGSCPYLSLAVLRTCSETCTGDSACSEKLKCCFNGCARTCVTPGYVYAPQSSTTEEAYSSTPASENTFQPSSSPTTVHRMSFVLKLVGYTWSNDLLQSSSDYHRKLQNTIIQNFNEQFSRMPGYVGVEVVSFRSGGPFVDLVITYAPPATDGATVLNTVFLLTQHGFIHYLQVHNYLRFDHVVKTGSCPPVSGLGPCNLNCTGDSRCRGKQRCCSNGCGLTCTDLWDKVESSSSTTSIKTTPTDPPTTKPTTRQTTIPTTNPSTTQTTYPTTTLTTIQIPPLPQGGSLLSVTIELLENNWDTSLLDPRSSSYQSLYSTIKTNILQLFRLTPGITDVFIQSFRARNRVDLVLQYNTESIALIDIITKLIAARSSGAIHELRIHQYMTFDTQMKPGVCPAYLVRSGACVENCMGDGTCPGNEKCCSTGCGRVCTSVQQPV